MEDIKQIRTYTLSDYMIGCYSYEEVVDYLSNVLVNEGNTAIIILKRDLSSLAKHWFYSNIDQN